MSTKKSRPHFMREWDMKCKWIIDGTPYIDSGAVYRVAKEKGFAGTYYQISRRLNCGDHTWDRLCRPVDESRSSGQKKTRQKKCDEMAEVLAALDARKKEMGQ